MYTYYYENQLKNLLFWSFFFFITVLPLTTDPFWNKTWLYNIYIYNIWRYVRERLCIFFGYGKIYLLSRRPYSHRTTQQCTIFLFRPHFHRYVILIPKRLGPLHEGFVVTVFYANLFYFVPTNLCSMQICFMAVSCTDCKSSFNCRIIPHWTYKQCNKLSIIPYIIFNSP